MQHDLKQRGEDRDGRFLTGESGKRMITSSVDVTSSHVTSTHAVVRTEMGLDRGELEAYAYVVSRRDVK